MRVMQVGDKAIAIIFEDEDEVDVKFFTIDEAEDLSSRIDHVTQDMRMAQYVGESTEGEQP